VTTTQYGLPPAEIREAEEAFWRYDTDRSGTIDRNELKPLLRYSLHSLPASCAFVCASLAAVG
jgi:Ca2+-binding EF-hand superfamily protein